MMKTSYMAAAVLALLLALLLWQQQPQSTSQNLPTLPAWKVADVHQVHIFNADGNIVQATRQGQTWLDVTTSNSADKQHINALYLSQLLTDLNNMQIKRVVSHQTQHFSRFTVGETATQVQLLDAKGNTLFHVFVGKPTQALVSTYLRFAQNNAVLTVNKVLTWQIRRTPASWLEKTNEE